MLDTQHHSSKRGVTAAFGTGLAVTLVAGVSLGIAPFTNQLTHAQVPPERSIDNVPHQNLHEPSDDERASCGGGLAVDFKVDVVPRIDKDSVNVEINVANETKEDLDTATVTQLVAVDGSVIASTNPSLEKTVRGEDTITTRSPEAIYVPHGYYTLLVTVLGVSVSGKIDPGSERTAEAEVYLHSDGTQVRMIDYSEWYFHSGSMNAAFSDEENN